MRRNANRILPTKRTRNVLTTPHIMYRIIPTLQTRNVGKRKGLVCGAVTGVDNEDVCAFGRCTSIIFWGRRYWGIGCRVERSGWTAKSAVLMECEELGVLDNCELESRQLAQLRQVRVRPAIVYVRGIVLTSVPNKIGLLRNAQAAK